MNTGTGELRYMKDFADEEAARAAGFVAVSKEFEKEALRILTASETAGTSAYADMTDNTPLVKWARAQQHKKKSRAKMPKASKRRNRR